MRHEPDARALVNYAVPVAERHVFADLFQGIALIAAVGDYSEGVGRGVDRDLPDNGLKSQRQSAAVAGHYETDSVRVTHIEIFVVLFHHNDVCVTKLFCDVLGDIQAVAGA